MMSRVIPELCAMSTRTAINGSSWTSAAPAQSPRRSTRRLFSKGGAKRCELRTTLLPDLLTHGPRPIRGQFIEYLGAIQSAHSAIGIFDRRCTRAICCIAVTSLRSDIEHSRVGLQRVLESKKNSGGASMAPPLMLTMSPSSDLARAIQFSITSCRPEAFRPAFRRLRPRLFLRASPPPCTLSSAAGSPPTPRSAARCERPWSGR